MNIAKTTIQMTLILIAISCPISIATVSSAAENELRSSSENATAGNHGGEIEVEECVVRFGSEIEVPALETGRIANIAIQRNDQVTNGSPIARLDDQSLLIRRRAAELRVTSAKEEAEDDVEIRYAEVALAEAEAELDNSRSIQNDVRGAIPLTQMRRMRLAVQRGELEVAQAKKRSSRARLELQLRQADVSVIDDQLKNLHAQSPIDGVVLEVTKQKGEWIEKGKSIAKIGQMNRLHLHALVRSDLVSPRHCKGLPISVHWVDDVDGTRRSLSGTVLSVDPQALPGGRYRLHAEIKNERSGSRKTHPSQENWLLVPGTSVQMKVYVPENSIARKSNAKRF
ncbi:dihydrolipoamide acetyltransferase [Rubripirellula obstinata]|uniref:Dihydrolipoamide acetyltransferase n=1 Tax=Rubripirellula obstinata TaxID=406547 RepID=A0A5B1CIL0_9BACT|nr:HlyD family efflux transporter periplasmic adaptor subunit [Rubripirellula obstinata]KAA1259440.1 dihydrolipoamide acetyltransferase [Rubripirellula obstinata]